MNKYTISKVFQRKFQGIIWKIEIDTTNKHIAIQTRHPETTLSSVSVLQLDGTPILIDYSLDEKEWILHAVESNLLIFKKIGDSTPIKEGILILNILTQEVILRSYEYILIDAYENILKVKHRLYASGMYEYLNIHTGNKYPNIEASDLKYPISTIDYPMVFDLAKPSFLQDLVYHGDLLLSKVDDLYLWCYHVADQNKFHVHLSISNLNHILASKVLLTDLEKLLLQPYFKIGNQLFLMTYNKQEIVSYLV